MPNPHFEYQESLTRIETEIRSRFAVLLDFCDEDKEHLIDYRNRLNSDDFDIISESYSLYHSEAGTAMQEILRFIQAERVKSEGQQSLELAVV